MNPLLRVMIVLMTFFGVYVLGIFTMILLSLEAFGTPVALVIAVIVAILVWPRTRYLPRSALGAAGYGAVILGSIGFVAGFFGPMLLAPAANQGPLLGIFITGPGGALMGAVGGFAYGVFRAGPT